MAVISTVNFEDLFDFSPEPLGEPIEAGFEARQEANNASSSSSVTLQQQQQHPPTATTPPTTTNIKVEAATEPNTAASAQETKSPPLSQSVPASWGGSSSGGGRSTTEFTTSVDQLLETLPEHSSSGTSADGQGTSKGRRGRKPGQKNLKTDMKSKLERSRQSARECRARKKLRYQYLDDLLLEREKANIALREELVTYLDWCKELDKGRITEGLRNLLKDEEQK